MEISEIRTLFDYNRWANALILQTTALLPPDQWTLPAPTSHHSLRATLVHILGAESVWRVRCQEGISPTALLNDVDFPDLSSLTARWQTHNQHFQAYLAGLSSPDLSQRIHYVNTRGEAFDTPLWHILLHVVNHGTQFRSEAAMVLTAASHSPGDLDLIYYLREIA